MKNGILALLGAAALATSASAQVWDESGIEWKEKELWQQAMQHETPKWFMDAKYGVYFHWGIYSYMGKGEWYSRQMYDEIEKGFGATIRPDHLKTYGEDVHYHHFIPFFTAERYDAKEWAKLFKDAGFKFAGITAEHCDNFSNWDSSVNRFNTVNYGPKRDLVGELGKAIKAEGLKYVTTFHHSWEWGWYNLWSGRIDTSDPEFLGFYGEWTPKETFNSFSSKSKHAASGQFYGEVQKKYAPSKSFVNIWKEKIFEVIDQYEPDLLWFDSRLFLLPEKDRAEMVNYYYERAKERNQEVVLTYKNLDLPVGSAVIDLEQGRMDSKTDFPWLTDASYAWYGWSWKADLNNKTPNDLVDELVDIVSKNGCLILGITPTADGVIPREQREGMLQVGKWLKTNGEAIYESRPFVVYGEGTTKLKTNTFGGVVARGVKFTNTDFRFTTNGNYLYIIQLAPPKAGEKYTIKTLAKGGESSREVQKISMLGSKAKVVWERNSNGLTFSVSDDSAPFDEAVVYKVKLK
ncbi:MAG: alpha-L-fucosidase [Rikenellaceae bacterium]